MLTEKWEKSVLPKWKVIHMHIANGECCHDRTHWTSDCGCTWLSEYSPQNLDVGPFLSGVWTRVWAEKDLYTATADVIPKKDQSRISVVLSLKELGQCQVSSVCSITYYYFHGFEWGMTSVNSCFVLIKGVQTIVVCGPVEHMKQFLIDAIQSLLSLCSSYLHCLCFLWRNETALRRHSWTWRSDLSVHRQKSRMTCESLSTPEGCWSLVRPHHYQLLNTVPWRESETYRS